MKRIPWFLGFLMGFGSQASLGMSWSELMESTKVNSPLLQSLEAERAAAKYSRLEKTSSFLPEVGLSFRKQTRFFEDTRAHSQGISLNITQNIYSGFKDHISLDISKMKEEKFDFSAQKSKAELYGKLLSDAAQYVYSRDLTKLNEDIEERLRRNLNLVRLRFDVGSENKGSVLLSEASLKQAVLDLNGAKNLLADATSRLQDSTGIANVSSFDGKLPLRKPQLEPVPSDELTNPSLKELEFDTRIAHLETKLVKSGYSPRVDLKASRTLTSSEESDRSEKGLVELSVTVPLFSGFSTVHASKRAFEEERAISHQRKDKADTLKNSLVKVMRDWNSAYDALSVAESYEKAMILRTEIARKKYSNGLLSFEEWERIEQDLILKQKALLSARKTIAEAQATYHQLTGRGEF